jgi:pyruvate dehydrogenase E2 component (dihydrolipoamide acetyltransferase)
MEIEVKIPVMGENIKEGQVVSVGVKVGDTVAAGQAILEVETGKATIEVPSPQAGTVATILTKAGDKVVVGQGVMLLSVTASAAAPTPPAAAVAAPASPAAGAAKDVSTTPAPSVQAVPSAPVQPSHAQAPSADSLVVARPQPEHLPVAAAPSVRLFARELGVDIRQVPASSANGRITIEDVKGFVKRLSLESRAQAGVGAAFALPPLPDFSRFGAVKNEAMSTIRLRTAEHMARCWANIPHVTQHAKGRTDVLERLRKRYAAQGEAEGVKITITAFVLKMVAQLLIKYPKFNASIDMAKQEIIYKDYVHIGVAVDTERGLLVPVLRDVNKKSVLTIARELAALAAKARSGKISPDDLAGGTFTVTNLGGIGGSFFTPIINSPEVAILGLGRTVLEAVPAADGTFETIPMMPLSLSYDHRLIDGAEGARFIAALVEDFEEPATLVFS